MSESIKVSIELADKAAQKSLDDFITRSASADKGLKKLGDTGHETFNEIAVEIGKSIGVYDIFAGNLAANLVTKGFEIMKDAAKELFNVFITEGVHAAQEAQDALNSLNVALAQSGIYSKATSHEFVEYAKNIQATTAFEDDLVLKNLALLQSLAQLDKEGLQRASKAAIELSAALGRDLQSTTEAVAKAANGNYKALNLMGIQFDKTGSQAQIFENVLRAVEARLGGAATSKLSTFSGALAQAKNNFNDLQEEFGNLIIKNPVVIAALSSVSKIIENVAENGFPKGAEGARALGQGLLTLIDIAGVTVRVFDGILTTILTVYDGIIVSTTAVLSSIVGLFAPFSETIQAVFENLTLQSNQSLDKIGERLNNGGVLTGISATIETIGLAAKEGFDKIGTGADDAAPKIDNVKNSIAKLTEEQQRQLEETNKYVDALAKKNASNEENQKLELENLKSFYEQKDLVEADADIVNYQAKIEREQEFQIARQAILDQTFADEQTRILSSTQSEEVKTAALLQIQKKYEADSAKSNTEYFKKKVDYEKASDKETVSNRKDTFSTIATLSSSSNQTLAAIGKAAAITNATIDGYAAVQKALASAPPPFNFALAGLVGVATAANVAKIAGVNFAEGGIVPGSSFSGDRVAANVNSGEMILNRTQQAELFKTANGDGGGSGSGIREQIAALGNSIRQLASQPISIQVDGRELFNLTRDQLASGRAY